MDQMNQNGFAHFRCDVVGVDGGSTPDWRRKWLNGPQDTTNRRISDDPAGRKREKIASVAQIK
jgi:hypothetical protein